MIKWSKYFDKIYCIHYNNYSTRKQLMEFQLKRIGILDSGIFEWQLTFNDGYLQKLKNALGIKDKIAYVSDTQGHLNAVKRAYYQGANRVLIIEDDARFLKDLNKIEEILQNIPDQKDWTILLLNKCPQCDSITYFNTIKNRKNFINRYFCKIDQIYCFSGACYCLNRRGMKLMFDQYYATNYCVIDWIWNKRHLFNKVCSLTNIAVQINFINSINQKNTLPKFYNNVIDTTLEIQKSYQIQDLNWDDYYMRKDGSPYNYGDFIEE